MRSNPYKAPLSYRENAQARPVKEGRPAPSPPRIRIYICVRCRRPGGTLRNIGTHREPCYICDACRLNLEKLELLKKQTRPAVITAAPEDEEEHIDKINREMSQPPSGQEKVE